MQSRIAGIGLASLFILFALVLLLIERAPPIVAALAFLVAALGASWTLMRERVVAAPHFWLIGGFLVWLVASASWSIAGAEAAENSLRIAAMMVVAASLPVLCLAQPANVQATAGRWAVIASCLAICLLLFETLFDMPLLRTSRYLFNGEIFTDSPPADLNQIDGIAYYPTLHLSNRLTHLASVVSILVLPTASYLWTNGPRLFALAMALAAVVGLVLAPAQTPLAAALVGFVVALLFLIPAVSHSRNVPFALAATIAVAVIVSPWLAEYAYSLFRNDLTDADPSIIHRFAIWDYAAGLIAERPVAGSGIESARALGREGTSFEKLVPGHPITFQALPLHPHNASIQIWLELGGVGALIFSLFLFVMTRTIHLYSNQVIARAGLVGGWVSTLTVAHLSYGIWQYWWVASLGLVCAMLALMFAPEREG